MILFRKIKIGHHVVINTLYIALYTMLSTGRYMIQFHYANEPFCLLLLFFCCCSFPASVFPSYEYLSLKNPLSWVWWTPIDMFIACSFLSRSRESERDGGGVINVAGRLGLKRSRQSSAAAVLKIDFSYAILPNVCD